MKEKYKVNIEIIISHITTGNYSKLSALNESISIRNIVFYLFFFLFFNIRTIHVFFMIYT